MGIEFELKFSATPEQQAAIRAAYAVEYREFSMETTYYDTASFHLSEDHITLRSRLENGERVWTVKAPAGGYGRGEWDCHGDDLYQAVVHLVDRGAPMPVLLVVGYFGVEPVCGARFTRLAGLVEHNGTVLELALDAGVLTGKDTQIPLCEVEVELKSGSPENAVAFGKALAERFALIPELRSKFRRALALAKGEQHG